MRDLVDGRRGAFNRGEGRDVSRATHGSKRPEKHLDLTGTGSCAPRVLHAPLPLLLPSTPPSSETSRTTSSYLDAPPTAPVCPSSPPFFRRSES